MDTHKSYFTDNTKLTPELHNGSEAKLVEDQMLARSELFQWLITKPFIITTDMVFC